MQSFKSAAVFGFGAAVLVGGSGDVHAEGREDLRTALVVDATIQLQAVHSSKCLDLDHGRVNNGIKAQQWTCNGTDAQKWQAIPVSDSLFELRSVASGKCLEVENSSSKAGADVQQWECSGGKQMRWQMVLIDPNNGHFQLRPTHTEDRCLDIDGAGRGNGARAQQWYCNQSEAQRWQVRTTV
ncbi:RICIN domain-containing protein [Streptomyces olivoreticuli]|uniref:RICIN domain-containing protein n=1 Tax=Streptomyces olivoreticuli TaxID=68246 RepID=UPI0034637A50